MKKIIFLLFIMATSVWAGPYPIPVPYKSEPSNGVSRSYFYTVVTEIGTAGDQILPTGYKVTMFAREYGSNKTVVANDFTGAGYTYTNGVRTLQDLVMEAYNRSSEQFKNGSLTYLPSPEVCFAWGALPGHMSDLRGPWSSLVNPVGCIVVPPVDNTCRFLTPEILLDHGTLNKAEGDIKKAQASVQCSIQTDVKFSLATNDNYVYLDEGTSEITVNNLPLGSKITLPAGDASIEIEDKLSGVVTAGAHSGSNVLIIVYY